jgi:hypothetical protein
MYFYCEYLCKSKHNVLKYNRIPRNNLYLFGVCRGDTFLHGDDLLEWANKIDVEPVNILRKGEIKSIDDVADILSQKSILGDENIEGIVIKNYSEPAMLGSMIIPLSMAKYVREEFKERHKKDTDKYTPADKLKAFIDSFRTEARWQKAVSHLMEKGELEDAPRDIGRLIKEIEKDLREECSDAIAQWLYRHFERVIIKRTCAGFPEWYKTKLAEKAF